MNSVMISNGAGMDIELPDLRKAGRVALRLLFKLPPTIRDSLIFGSSRLAVPLQKAIVRSLGGTYFVKTKFTDGPMRGQLLFCNTAEKYFYLGSHVEDDVQKVLKDNLRDGDVCYDVGGHIGYMALLFSAIVGSTGKVFCFEPSPTNFLRVKRNVEANDAKHLRVMNLAASNREGKAVLVEDGSMSTIAESPTGSNDLSDIRTIRLDDFVYRDGNPAPSFIKLDVEGHAGPALEGARQIFDSVRPILMVEIHDDAENERVRTFLSPYHYGWSFIGRSDEYPKRVINLPH